jgi:dienelactone hydrolase
VTPEAQRHREREAAPSPLAPTPNTPASTSSPLASTASALPSAPSARAAASWLGVSGAALAALAGTSWLAAGLGAWLLGVAFWLWRRPTPPATAWAVVGGALALLCGVWLVLAGQLGAGLVAAVSGAAAAFVGTQRSLAAHPTTRPVPARRSLSTQLAVAADETMKWYWHATQLVSPPPDPGLWIDSLRAAAERNRASGILADPARAHVTPPTLAKVRLARLDLIGLPSAEALRFESEFEPRDPEVRERYLAQGANRTAHATLWRHRRGPRPTLILIHGYGMGRPGLDARAFDVERLHRGLGLDVAQVVLPLHGARAPGRRSGAGFLDGHPLATNAAFEQAVFELRRLAGWLRAQGAPALGVHGMSLGGYTSAVFASLERGLACAVPLIPAVSLPAILGASRSPEQANARRALGLDDRLFAEAWASHDPLRHQPLVAPEGRLVLAGLRDRICPPDQAEALWEHWRRPAIHWFAGSHLAPFGRRGLRERLDAHLRATLLADATPTLSRFRAADRSANGAARSA